MIAGLNVNNYFDTVSFLDETSAVTHNTLTNDPNQKKLTIFLPAVEELSEVSEQSQEMITSLTHQLSSKESPLVRKS